MKEWVTLTEHNWTFWLAGVFALAEFLRWLFTHGEFFLNIFRKILKFFGIKITIKTKRQREREEEQKRLDQFENSIREIQETSKRNVQMFLDHEIEVVRGFNTAKNEIVSEIVKLNDKVDSELGKLNDKVDEQNQKIVDNQKENDETDCAMLRDRLNSAMRYFTNNRVDEDGNVHISLGDYETLDGLFEKYFAKNGNGAYKKAYKEFKDFIIDR